jgi:polysaccharide biosynthesis transport protein
MLKPSIAILGPSPATSGYLEAYRRLRAAAMTLKEQRGFSSALITSAGAHEGKTTLAINLATVLAQAQRETILIDVDFPRPQVHEVVGIPKEPGVTDVCKGLITLDDALQDPGIPYLRVLPVGGHASEGADLASSERMSDVIREAAGSAEYVLLDGAPVLGYSGTLQLAPRIDLVLFVARARGYVAPVQRALRALGDVGAEVPGIIVNDVMPTDQRYYGYPSYYHYYYYSSKNPAK